MKWVEKLNFNLTFLKILGFSELKTLDVRQSSISNGPW